MIAERALVIAQTAHERLTKEFNWVPREKTHIILSDESDQPNGYATPIFFNRTVLFLSIFYNVVIRVSAGLAHGFDEDVGDELAYLRIGSSF